MPNSTRSNSPNKGSPVAVRPPDALTPHLISAIDAFGWLVESYHKGDFYKAKCARQTLRRLGWSVAPCLKGGD